MIVTASVLNVRSGPGTNFRVLGVLTVGDRVTVQETNGDWVWVDAGSSLRGWVNQAYLSPDSILQPPTPDALEKVFGMPCSAACSAGRVTLPAPLKLGWQNAKVTRVACHKEMEPVFTAVFAAIHAAGLWHLLTTFDGIYNCRVIKGGQSRSTHSWGISVDLNAATNRQGAAGNMDMRIVTIFERHGFHWGGRFGGTRRDDMHFEFVKR